MNENKEHLKVLPIYDNLLPIESVDVLESLLEKARLDMRNKKILKEHKPVQMSNGHWYIRLGNRKVERVNLSDLEREIIMYYTEIDYSLCTIFPEYLERRKKEVAETTWSKDQFYFTTYIQGSKLGKKPIKNLVLQDGYDFFDYCKKLYPELKQKYWKNIKGTLRSLIRYAITRQVIHEDPFMYLRPSKDNFTPATKHKDADTVFSKEEQKKVSSIAIREAETKSNALPLGIALIFNLGLRMGELCALKWGDIESIQECDYLHIQRELVSKVDDVTGKTKGVQLLDHCKSLAGDRRLPLNQNAKGLLVKIREYNEMNHIPTTDEDLIFQRNENGKLFMATSRCFETRLKRYCREANMSEEKSVHDIRRTVITNLYKNGMPLVNIQKFAGHASLSQTRAYIRLDNTDISMLNYIEGLS